MATKRPRGPPTGQTPKKPNKIPKKPSEDAPRSGKRNRKLVFDHEEDEGASCPVSSDLSDSDNSQQMNVLSTHEVVKYVIPSFSIVKVNLRHAIVTFGTSSEQVSVFFNTRQSSIFHSSGKDVYSRGEVCPM